MESGAVSTPIRLRRFVKWLQSLHPGIICMPSKYYFILINCEAFQYFTETLIKRALYTSKTSFLLLIQTCVFSSCG